MTIGEAGRNPGDIGWRLAEVERKLNDVLSARRLVSASIGAGGLRIQGGRVLAEDASAEPVFEVTTEPPAIFMRPELISTVAVQAFADRIHTAVVQTSESTTTTSYTDLATVGPIVPDVPVTSTGRCIVFVSCLMLPAASNGDGVMSFAISGASSHSAGAFGAFELAGDNVLIDGTRTVLVEGLNEGSHTFTAKYRSPVGNSTSFAERTLVVIAF